MDSKVDFSELKVEFVSAGNHSKSLFNSVTFADPSKNKLDIGPQSKKLKFDPKISIARVECDTDNQEDCACVIRADCSYHTEFMERTLLFQQETTRLLREILDLCTSKENSATDVTARKQWTGKKIKYFPVKNMEKFKEIEEMCQDEHHKRMIKKQFSDLRGDPTEETTTALLNRTFLVLFTDDFLIEIARSKLQGTFVGSQTIALLQEVWLSDFDNKKIAKFRKEVRYCISLAKGRVYKKTLREKPKYEEEYLIEAIEDNVQYEDDIPYKDD